MTRTIAIALLGSAALLGGPAVGSAAPVSYALPEETAAFKPGDRENLEIYQRVSPEPTRFHSVRVEVEAEAMGRKAGLPVPSR